MFPDPFSPKVVGWSMSDSSATPLVWEALRRSIESRQPVGGGLLLDSDRGWGDRQRLHQTLGYKNPYPFETEYIPVLAA